MTQMEAQPERERRARDRSAGLLLRRRQQQEVEEERRRSREDGFDIAAALELYLDECKTRGAMTRLLESWLAEARNAAPESQDPDYVRAVERAIQVMSHAHDVETGIAMLQRRGG